METQWIGLRRLDKLKKNKEGEGRPEETTQHQLWEIKTSNPENRVGGRENTVRRSSMFKQSARGRRQNKAEAMAGDNG